MIFSSYFMNDTFAGDGRVARLITDKHPDISIQGIDVRVRTDAAIPVGALGRYHTAMAALML